MMPVHETQLGQVQFLFVSKRPTQAFRNELWEGAIVISLAPGTIHTSDTKLAAAHDLQPERDAQAVRDHLHFNPSMIEEGFVVWCNFILWHLVLWLLCPFPGKSPAGS